MELFQHQDYKDAVRARINHEKGRRGYHGLCAKAAGCTASYLSQVLNGTSHLTPDHGAGLCQFWEFSDVESDYFLGLIHFGRAGTSALRQRLKRQLQNVRRNQRELTAKFSQAKIIRDDNSLVEYYSDWRYAAFHVALGISELQDTAKLAERFGMQEDKVVHYLEYLCSVGLVRAINGRWERVQDSIHLPRESFMAGMAHRNWRQHSMTKDHNSVADDLFFSSVYSISRLDYWNIRERLVGVLQEARAVVVDSQDEDVYCLICDWFRV